MEMDIPSVAARSAAAFRSFRLSSGAVRAQLLETIASHIEAIGAPLIQTAMAETNLPEARLAGERGRTCTQLRQYAALVRDGSWVEARIDTALPDRQPLPKPDIRKMMVPLGPVVVFGASNFPLAYSTAGVDTCSALAAGCTVILKAHPAHPRTSDLVANAISSALRECGLHHDIFIHVHADSFEAGKQLVQHPLVKAVGFTGSFSGGKALYDYATARHEPIPVFAEMGSINPVFILPGALKARPAAVADMYAASITQSVGQFCTNPGLLLSVQSNELDQFKKLLGDRLAAIAPAPMLHDGISRNYQRNREHALAQKGVRLVATSNEPAVGGKAPATLAEVSGEDFVRNPALSEEVFGPYSLLVCAGSLDDLRKTAENIHGQLTATIIAEPDELAQLGDLINVLREKAGRVIINGVPTGVEVCPAMQHGGPFPATTDSRFSSVGTDAIRRWVRPVAYQNFPDNLLPDELKNANPLGIWRLYNGQWGRA